MTLNSDSTSTSSELFRLLFAYKKAYSITLHKTENRFHLMATKTFRQNPITVSIKEIIKATNGYKNEAKTVTILINSDLELVMIKRAVSALGYRICGQGTFIKDNQDWVMIDMPHSEFARLRK